jgi:hypothetical protein
MWRQGHKEPDGLPCVVIQGVQKGNYTIELIGGGTRSVKGKLCH